MDAWGYFGANTLICVHREGGTQSSLLLPSFTFHVRARVALYSAGIQCQMLYFKCDLSSYTASLLGTSLSPTHVPSLRCPGRFLDQDGALIESLRASFEVL
jgi:hypothetical protein